MIRLLVEMQSESNDPATVILMCFMMKIGELKMSREIWRSLGLL